MSVCSCRKLELTTREIQVYNGCVNSQIPGMWGEWEYNTCLPIPSLAAWLPFSKPKAALRVCTQSLGTHCRIAWMRWGKFRAMSLQWSRNREAVGKIPLSLLKSAVLLGSLQAPPKALSQDIARYQIFATIFNSFDISDWPEESFLHSQLPQVDFQGLQEQCCKVWDKFIQ